MASSARNDFVGYICTDPDEENEQRCLQVDARSMTDPTAHGTSVVGPIAGAMGGVNPNARIIPFVLSGDPPAICIIRALRTVLALQLGTSNVFNLDTGIYTPPRAVLNFSFGQLFFPVMNDILDEDTNDVWEILLPRLRRYNVDVVTAAGNGGPGETVDFTTPQVHGGPDSHLIIVGSTDASGFASTTTQFAPAHLKLVDIYAIGEDILVPWASTDVPGQRNLFATRDGTSFSAPIITGLLSMLIARQDITGTVSNGVKAKDILRAQAINFKGQVWPNIEGYFIPRAATPWGPIACSPPARFFKPMTSLSFHNIPSGVPAISASAVTLNFASYTEARPVSYVFSILIRPIVLL